MSEVTKFKATITGVFGVLSGIFGVLAIPIFLLVLSNIIDYATGILASKFRGQQITSYKGIRGITKKVCMWLLIVVGAILDELIKYSTAQFGLVIPTTFIFACVVAIWLICNELISILENLKDIGVPLPAFLLKFTKNIKSQIEVKTDVVASDKEGEDDDGN
ncbi:MAG: phage holin family protein [Lachnospiraceae bacterium]|nr:phage holin family protein [Lachnospiraceae bacterium]